MDMYSAAWIPSRINRGERRKAVCIRHLIAAQPVLITGIEADHAVQTPE